MPQIANQDYNVIDFNVLPYYEGVERLYRAYINGTAFDCIARENISVEKIIAYNADEEEGREYLLLKSFENAWTYIIKAPLATDVGGYLVLLEQDNPIYIVSADGFKLKSVVQDGVLTGVEVTTEKVLKIQPAQYFKEWMIGQPSL